MNGNNMDLKLMYKKFLGSTFIWRLTGLTYCTAVIATHGAYVNKNDYLKCGIDEMSSLSKYFDKSKTVLEFGCGLGKNLFGVSENIKFGYGIDINGLYIQWANRLKNTYKISNLSFIKYDGVNFPSIPPVDIIFEKGVFERLSKTKVRNYIKLLKEKYLKDNGFLILYFLMEKAKGTSFTKRLGDDAYVFWSDNEIGELLDELNLRITEVQEWGVARVYICTSV